MTARTHHRTARAGTLIGGALFALVAGALPALAGPPGAGAAVDAARSDGSGSLVMVLDSSGSMGDDDGTGHTRMESARTAVGTVVDGLPDGYPTGLRVYGADHPQGCTDTRLVRPVQKLDRAAVKRAVAGVRPRGDTPIGLSLRKAAQDLPEPTGGAIGTRTVLLISDGEDNCGTPQPCEVAEQLGREGIGLRIDTVGFQVKGAARKQLECIANAGNGRYYDAPDAKALARQLQRASQLSADGYRLRGRRVAGAATADRAPVLVPGQYLDTIGPGEKRYYAADLDSESTVDLAATAVPQPGAAVDTFDALSTRIEYDEHGSCGTHTERFAQKEGAVPLTSAVARIRSKTGTRTCDRAGRYRLVVERESKKGSDAARWPLELVLGAEAPLAKGVTPAQSQTEYGRGGKEATLPAGNPRDVRGGTGFNDARTIAQGVWRDRILPSQTLWYKVPASWGQQVRYDVEFANEPTVDGTAATYSYGATRLYTPARHPLTGGGEFSTSTMYSGRPSAVAMGGVPVAWTNRYEDRTDVQPVHAGGEFYISVTLGAQAAEIAENPQIGLVLRVSVLGEARTGPEHGAPAAAGKAGGEAGQDADKRGDSIASADSGGAGGAGWTGIAAAAGAGVMAVLVAVFVYVRSRRGSAARTTRGSA
ncbi:MULTISPECIES: VWA domain-containing protein [unclassified Streptomyces]|uniref:vWA domain-containing protein n=1 Tax=unclassified Streptomyces TaxID=2593676 RepID=UPI0022521492|nr:MULTISPECIES: VWA domain-containing protein [unclassified Streptomyces]MCX5141454.1 VWA domain-containing protein [Streptomyces sp. NBC_00338]WRZ65962.1 VWA domain-containing protein [Streptomyces sp. NBC_01257]WSU59974.1 VWA domain-containing protein [Streptomyces sp. NBC_01104]